MLLDISLQLVTTGADQVTVL